MALPIPLKNGLPPSTQNRLSNNFDHKVLIENQVIEEYTSPSSDEWDRILGTDAAALPPHPTEFSSFHQQQIKNITMQEMLTSAASSGYASMGKYIYIY